MRSHPHDTLASALTDLGDAHAPDEDDPRPAQLAALAQIEDRLLLAATMCRRIREQIGADQEAETLRSVEALLTDRRI